MGEWIERLEPRESRRELEQQREELPVGEPEQEHARQPEQQPRLPLPAKLCDRELGEESQNRSVSRPSSRRGQIRNGGAALVAQAKTLLRRRMRRRRVVAILRRRGVSNERDYGAGRYGVAV